MTTNKIPTDEDRKPKTSEDFVEFTLANIGYKYIFTSEERARIKGLFEQARAAGRQEGLEEALEINHTYGHTRLEKGTIFKSDALRAADAIRDRIEKLRSATTDGLFVEVD